jgi:hypothetical protein
MQTTIFFALTYRTNSKLRFTGTGFIELLASSSSCLQRKQRRLGGATLRQELLLAIMSVTVRKAGEVATKALRPAGLRAVSKEEIPFVEPARESTKVSLTPWRGWFTRWMRDTLGEERYLSIRKAFYYQYDDEFDLMQQPYPNVKVRISNEDPNLTAMFRYPSPGSQDAVRLPKDFGSEEGGDPYNNNYYVRDTRRRYSRTIPNTDLELLKLALMDDSPEVEEMKKKVAEGPKSSPGNKGRFATGPSDFDPTGLRATMSANHEALNKSLDSHMPDHVSESLDGI